MKHGSVLRLVSMLLTAFLVFTLGPGQLFVGIQGSRAQSAPSNVDLMIQKTHVGDLVIGTPAVFTISVTNQGTEAVTGPVTISDNLPAGLTPSQAGGVGWTPCGFSGQLLTCVYSNTLGIAPGATLQPVIVVATVLSSAAPQVINTAVLTNASDTNAANNTSSDTARVVSADLAVTKRVSNALPAEGALINYTLRLSNSGPTAANSVVLTDTLPSGLTFAAANPTQGSYNIANGAWGVGDLAVGQAVTLTLSAVVNTGTRGQTITNATNGLVSNRYDYNSANNTASVSLRVQSTRLIGRVTDQVTALPVISATVVVTDSLSHVYTTLTSSSGWYTFTETSAAPLAAGTASMKVSKTGYRASTVSPSLSANADNRQDVQLGTTDLQVKMTDGKTTVVPGEIFTYTFVVSNTGTIPAAGVVISNVLPTYLTYITDTLGITHTGTTTGTLVWKLKTDLAARDTSITNQTTHRKEFKIRYRVAYGLPANNTSMTNAVSVRTSSPEANKTNNRAEDTNTNNSAAVANITITNAVAPTTVRTGQNATYTIKVTNAGTTSVTEAKVSDTFSTFLDIVSATTTKGTRTINNTTRAVSVDIGVLTKGETVTITVVGRVNSTATTNQTVNNTATLSYKYNGVVTTKTSTAVSFALQVSSTLPGTGYAPVSGPAAPLRAASPAPWLAGLSALALAVLAGGLMFMAYRTRKDGSDWSGWYLRMGTMLGVVAMVFAAGAAWLGWLSRPVAAAPTLQEEAANPQIVKQPQVTFEDEAPIVIPLFPANEPEKLPDYPVPTPTVQPDSGPPKDTSPVNRIVLSTIGLDTVVKYVPYNGLTWLIGGLKQEIAWMGDTSWPGLGGNTALAGHVTLADGSNGPFRDLEKLQPGDPVTIYTELNEYTYRVREAVVVEDTDFSVLDQAGETRLTLITCTQFDPGTGFYSRRLVVYADLVDTRPLEAAYHGN